MIKKSPFKTVVFALAVITGIYILAFFYGEKLLSWKIFSWNSSKNEVISITTENKVCFLWAHKNPCFKVQIADTDEKRRKGLMFVEKLPEDEGMLFTYNQEWIYSFWMKNTLIPLDIIWFNKDKKIVDIQTMQPCETDECPSYTPKWKAQYVLEVNAGLMQKYRIQTGIKADIILVN